VKRQLVHVARELHMLMEQRVSAVFLLVMVLSSSSCNTVPGDLQSAPVVSSEARDNGAVDSRITPELREVGSRGFYVLDGPFAQFDPSHPSVEIWMPKGDRKAPIMVYAHGGAGYREDDRARVAMFRRNGFATISFDSYVMNGFDDWDFVTSKVANSGKQSMIWGVFKGAVEYAAEHDAWDNRNIFLYGGSNGGRVVLYAGSEMANGNIRGIISEAPAGSGFTLGDYNIPTIIAFGALDTWAGKSATDYVWKRTYPDSPISIEDWVHSQRAKGRPVKFIFYENAGHLLFEGPLEKVTVRRGDSIAFTAYQGADEGVLQQYEHDVIAFAKSHLAQ
jgi:dienelactone hydrolase